MKDSQENIESIHESVGVEGSLKEIKERMDFQGSYLFYLMNFSNTIKAVAEYVNSEPSKFKHYSEEEISNFNFDQIETLLFTPKQKSTAPTESTLPKSNSILDETVLATKGVIADVISPVLNFTLGKEIKLSPEISASNYGKATAGIKETMSSLKDNDLVVEAVATARIALGNILVNKAAFVAIGIEPLPDPEWLKNTKSYKYTCEVVKKAAYYLSPAVMKRLNDQKEFGEAYAKLYNSKDKKIVGLVLAGLAARKGGKMLPLAFATAKVTYSTYFDYLANETTRAILDEKAHLEKYIDAKNRTNLVLEQNPRLGKALGIQKEGSITTDLDGQLTKIYADNPILKKLFQTDQQVFANEKEKVIFVQVLENLVKTNENLKGEYKIWQAGDLSFSEKKIKIAKIHFARIYKDKFKRYQEPKQAEVLSSVGMAVKKKLVDSLTALYSAIESAKTKDITALTYTLTSVFTGQSGKAFLNETKQIKNLTEIATLKMDVPEYGEEQEAIGTYKHDLANMAFNKQVEAATLERVAKKELSGSDEEIQYLYHYTKAKVEEDLKKDPLFSESILNPTITTKLYDMGAGLLNSLSPWGGKPTKVSEEKKSTKTEELSKDVPSKKEVQILENGPVKPKNPSKILQDLIPSDLQEQIKSFKVTEPSVDRSSPMSINDDSPPLSPSGSPTTTTNDFSPSLSPSGSPTTTTNDFSPPLSPSRSPVTTTNSFSPPVIPDKKFKDIISTDELTEIKKVTNIGDIPEIRGNDLFSKLNKESMSKRRNRINKFNETSKSGI